MKRINKFLILIATMFSLVTMLFAACGKKEEESALRGTFTNSKNIEVTISQDPLDESDKSQLYSNVWPYLNAGQSIAYNMDQSLKLKRDYTYVYDYSVNLRNPGEWGGDVATLSVSISGTFEFFDEGDGIYSVLLSNPTGGTLQVYGASIDNNRGDLYGWSKHPNPDLILDYDTLSHKEGYEYDVYVRSHVVVVNKNGSSISDDIFFPQILNYICNYCDH